jgi:hypothetical protein
LAGDTAKGPASLTLTFHELVNVTKRNEFKAIVPFREPFEKSQRPRAVTEHRSWSEPTCATHCLAQLRYSLLEKVRGWDFQVAVKAQPSLGDANERDRRTFQV